LKEPTEKLEWGQVDKIGKGTKANYDSKSKVLTFCFNRGPNTSSESLRVSRELLMKELKELGYSSRMKYNGEVLVEGVLETDVVLVKKNHKLIISLNKKQAEQSPNSPSGSLEPRIDNQSNIKFS
jgi:hypothetical protein